MGVVRGALLIAALFLIFGCTSNVPAQEERAGAPVRLARSDFLFLNRVTWGANPSSVRALQAQGRENYLEHQLHPPVQASLPSEVQSQIDAMAISRRSLVDIEEELQAKRKAFRAMAKDDAARLEARKAYVQELNSFAREASARMLLRAIYSPDQLREQMVWFWVNHFNVGMQKADLRALVADYEESAIRPYALGRFRDLLGASARHPAMLRYLDNERNHVGAINENYARELMELHTLGVNGGYTQADVQELARVLTGYTRFGFRPRRHDWGAKVFLGAPILARGAGELDEALDRLASSPATARFVSRQLAVYFVADDPPPALVERMAHTFLATGGDIAATLAAMFRSDEFEASLGAKFKDPVHWLVSAARLVLDGRPPPAEMRALIGALFRMGEPLYAHPTPEGYALVKSAWAGPGQLAERFEIARAIAYRTRASFEFAPLEATLGDSTRAALRKADSPRERAMLIISSPEFMSR